MNQTVKISRMDAAWDAVRAQRDALLQACDWTHLQDSRVDVLTKAKWATYRQALRDIPATFKTPDAVVWPKPPGA